MEFICVSVLKYATTAVFTDGFWLRLLVSSA